MNNTFEDQLTASARRLREAQDAKLHVAASPEITHSPTHHRSHGQIYKLMVNVYFP